MSKHEEPVCRWTARPEPRAHLQQLPVRAEDERERAVIEAALRYCGLCELLRSAPAGGSATPELRELKHHRETLEHDAAAAHVTLTNAIEALWRARRPEIMRGPWAPPEKATR